MPGQVQLSNDEQMSLLSARFPQRDEPNFAWGNVGSFYSILPALRAFWPCGPQIATAQSLLIADTANNFHLTAIHSPLFGYESLIQYVDFDGANDYATYADNAQFDIIGNEAYNVVPGLTLGCWVKPDNVASANSQYILSKWDNANALLSSYRLIIGGSVLQIAINTGVATAGGASTSTMVNGVWQFIAGRFRPGTFLDVYLSTSVGVLETTSNATALATIFNSALNFEMAADASNQWWYNGKVSLAWICASALSDTMINALYQLSRPLFGQ
jgi:hypothetical protein